MKQFIRSLSPWLEFSIVAIFAFGLFVYASLMQAIRPSASLEYTASRQLSLIIFELGVAGILFVFLRVRGWTFGKIGLRPNLADTGVGFFLFLAANLTWFITWNLTASLAPDLAAGISKKAFSIVAKGVPIWIIFAVSVINPIFEEIFETGYVITALRNDKNFWLPINVSVAIRLLCHLYQGPLGVLSITPLGLIFAIWYTRTRRLWPLIVAHSIMDLASLLYYSMR